MHTRRKTGPAIPEAKKQKLLTVALPETLVPASDRSPRRPRGAKARKGRTSHAEGASKARSHAGDDGDDEAEAGAGDDDELEGDEQRIEQLLRSMRMRGTRGRLAGLEASRVLVKWLELPHHENTWEPPDNLHPEALVDFEWRSQLPFTLSELLELTPFAPTSLLARERLLPAPAASRKEDEEKEDEADEDEDEESESESEEQEATQTAQEGSSGDGGTGEEWLVGGHEFAGARGARRFGCRKGGERVACGTITRWLAEDEAEGDPPLFRLQHDDGDEEDLSEDEARPPLSPPLRRTLAPPTPRTHTATASRAPR